jgi:uncharacterized protein YxjI
VTDRFDYDGFLVEQLIRPIVNLYRITPLAPGGTPVGSPVAFVRQKRLAIREDIRFFADEEEQQELFRLKARGIATEFGGSIDVTDVGGERIGVLEKRGARSLFRSSWRVLGPDEGERALAEEANVVVALLRRVVDLPLPYHFTLTSNGRTIGEVRRELSIRDRYRVDLAGDAGRELDRRLAVALAIALDAFEER